jgi:hypothetical protein
MIAKAQISWLPSMKSRPIWPGGPFGNTGKAVIRLVSILETAFLTPYQRRCKNHFCLKEMTSHRQMLIVTPAAAGDRTEDQERRQSSVRASPFAADGSVV